MITAKEAKEMATPVEAEKHLTELSEAIKRAAKRGDTSLTIRKQPYANWAYSLNDDGCSTKKAVFKKLRDNGFNLKTYYKESQFVDIGLIIEW